MKKKVEKVEKKGLICPKKIQLTNTEKEVLHLITDEFLTIKQIQLRRKCSLQAIYKLIKKIKQKGFLSGLKKVEKIQPTIQPNDVRLHAQEFNIKILFQDNKYQKSLNKSNILFIDSNTIRLYRNSIEIYSGNSFIGKNEREADKKAVGYWRKFFARLEYELGIIISKNRSRNIKEVNHHYARGNSEICENAIEHKEQIRVLSMEDGKAWFITDDSFGFKEDETIHPRTAKPDRKKVDIYVNDWREKNPPTNSQLAGHIGNVTQNQLIFAKNMKSHIEAIQTLSKEVKRLSKFFSSTIKENIKLKLGNQKTLGDF